MTKTALLLSAQDPGDHPRRKGFLTMAIIKYGPVISDARGSVGGTVFSRNAAGAIMKQRTTPTYPATQKQQDIASGLSTVIDDWKNALTTAQRDAWNSLAANTSLPNKIGEMFTPSGLNLFVKANMLLDFASMGHVTVPPVAAVAPAPQLTLDHLGGTGVRVTAIGNWDTTPTLKVAIQSLLNGPQSQNYYKGPYPNSVALGSGDFEALPLTITPWGDLVIDSRCHYRFRAIHSSGAASAAVYLGVDVGDPV